MSIKEFFRDLLYIKNIIIVVLVPIVLLPLLLVNKTPETTCAYCVAIMAIFWISEALPISVTALLPVFLFPVVGLLSVKATAMEYINDTSMLFVGGLIVAAAIEQWNIHKRIALKVLMMVGSEPRWLMLGLMGPTWFLSMWISNTATTAMMIPIASAILNQLKETDDRYMSAAPSGTDNKAMDLDEIELAETKLSTTNGESKQSPNGDTLLETSSADSIDGEKNTEDLRGKPVAEDDNPAFLRLSKALSLAIAYASNCGGIGSLTGTGPNLVFKGQLDLEFEKYGLDSPITFANWMGFGVPTSAILVVITWAWLQVMFMRSGGCCNGGNNKERDTKVKAVIRKEYEKLGPITFGQGAVLGHFILLALLWVSRDFGGEFGWGHIFKRSYVKDAVPAMFVSCSLFIFPSSIPAVFCRRKKGTRREPLQPLMTWKDAVYKVPWGVVFLLGGGFAMASASKASGLSAWIGEKLTILDYLEPWVLNLVLCYIVAAMTEVTSNTATCTLMMPILATLAVHLRQNPMYIMFPTAIATSFAFMLPVATPPNAVVFSYGYVRVVDMVKAGFMLNVISVLVLVAATETIGDAIFNMHTVPPEILEHLNSTV